MLRETTGVAAVVVMGAVLLGSTGQAAAQTTTTTPSTTTTTTTLLPHPFSDATRACILQAKAARRSCRSGGGDRAACSKQLRTDYPACFATGAGVTCAKRCVTNQSTCFGKLPTTKKNCRKTCVTTRKADGQACRRIARGDNLWAGGDASCLATADANLDLCRFVCSESAVDCTNAFKFCIANCANL